MNQENFPRLNIPRLEIPIQRHSTSDSGGRDRVYDPLRKKWVALTPEEWVRQHFIRWMINQYGYPPTMMANEYALNCNGRMRRCDTIVFTPRLMPLLIVEYKAPEINITQKVFDQIVRYNMECRANCLIVSNGLSHFCCVIDYAKPGYSFLTTVPDYTGLCRLAEC